MIYSNIYKRLIEWIEPIIKTLSKEDGINLNVYSELMDSQQTKGIIIKRIASNPEIETYITGEKLLQFKFSIHSIQRIIVNTENEKIILSQWLDKLASLLIKKFNEGSSPLLDIGYKAKSIEILNNSSLQNFDIDTLIYGIDVSFNYEYNKRSIK